MVKASPSQLPGFDAGVMVYSIVPIALLVLVSVPITFPVPRSPIAAPVTLPVMAVTSHANVLDTPLPPFPVSSILSCGSKLNGTSEHTNLVVDTPTDSGSTVTVTVNSSPVQPVVFAVGLTVYSITAKVLLVLLTVPVIFPVLASFKATPDTVPVISVTSQLKELDTPLPPFAVSSILFCGLISKFSFEQTEIFEDVPTGSGLIVIKNVSDGPSHSTS